MNTLDQNTQRATETWFRVRGLSALLEGTGLRTDVSARAVPTLAVMFAVTTLVLVPMFITTRLSSVVVGLASIPAAWVVGNLWRRRPLFAAVQRVGLLERWLFVGVPSLTVLLGPQRPPEVWAEEVLKQAEQTDPEMAEALMLTAQALFEWNRDHPVLNRIVDGVMVALWQVLVLIMVLLVVRLGLISMGTWLSREIWSSLTRSETALARALPLLVIVVTFAFYTAELWQSVGRLTAPGYILTISLFALAGGFFIARREQVELDELRTFHDAAEAQTLLDGSPLKESGLRVRTPAELTLNKRQQRSVRTMVAVSRLVLASVVGLIVAGFFVVLGMLTVSAADVQGFSTSAPDVIVGWTTSTRRFVLSWQHLRVAGFIGLFSAFYFAVVSATDEMFRDQMLGAAEDTVREACAVRLALEADAAVGSAVPDNPDPSPMVDWPHSATPGG